MTRLKDHIIFKSLIIVLSITLILPSFVKLSHSFAEHEHIVCSTPQDTHFHSYDLDCAFYKFKISTQYTLDFEAFVLITSEFPTDSVLGNFNFLSYSKSILSTLRGPPMSI